MPGSSFAAYSTSKSIISDILCKFNTVALYTRKYEIINLYKPETLTLMNDSATTEKEVDVISGVHYNKIGTLRDPLY